MSYPHRLRNLVLARMPSRAAAIIAMAVAIGLAVGANHGLAPRGDVPAVSFITFAAGTVTEGSPLWSAPGGGQRFLDVEAGTRVGIGGRAALFAGLARADVFWVSVAA
ncbi:MAG: hypothetical protein ACE5EL_05045, partial [Anaerolineae bacterium]